MATNDRNRIRLLIGSAVVTAAATIAGAQPANNTCATATAITTVPSTTNGTTVNATSDTPASSCAATADDTIDVWYTFTNGATTQTYTFDTNGTPDTGGNAGDTSLELYDGSCGGAIVGCDDDSGIGLASRVTYTMAANQTLKIRVAFLSNCTNPTCEFMGTVTGPFVLNVSIGVPPPPANDTCANAQIIASAPSSTLGDNDNSTGVDITPCSNTDEQDVWFSFVPAASGQYQIDTIGSTGNTDTSLAVFQGCPDELTPNVQPNWPANLLACDDDIVFVGGANDDYLSMTRANLQAGTAYKIRVSGFNNTTGGFVLNISAPAAALPAVPNTCATAQSVSGTFTQNYYTGGARPGGPAISCNAAGPIGLGVNDNALYLTFVPGANGNLSGSISAESGVIQSDSILGLFSGACGSLTEVACLDDPNNYDLSTLPPVMAGTNYVIIVGDYGTYDSGADISVNITVPGAANGACCSGTTCSVTSAAGCSGLNTRYAGNGSVCNLPGNSTMPCCKADFNQNGTVTVQDIFDFLAVYFSGGAQADINGAGGVTVQDIFDFLAVYFAGC